MVVCPRGHPCASLDSVPLHILRDLSYPNSHEVLKTCSLLDSQRVTNPEQLGPHEMNCSVCLLKDLAGAGPARLSAGPHASPKSYAATRGPALAKVPDARGPLILRQRQRGENKNGKSRKQLRMESLAPTEPPGLDASNVPLPRPTCSTWSSLGCTAGNGVEQ